MSANRFSDAPPALLALHAEHVERVRRMNTPAAPEAVQPAPVAAAPLKIADRVRDILQAVSGRYGVPVASITGPDRRTEVVRARHVAIYLARRLTKNSFPRLGRRFGGRSHSTIVHAARKIAALHAAGENRIEADLAAIAAALEPASPAAAEEDHG